MTMAAPATTATEWQWPADVLALAAESKVQQYLDPLLEMTRQVFPTARWLKVYVAQDPELRDVQFIVFDVQVAGMSPGEGNAAINQWIKELVHLYPSPRECVFQLLLDQV